MKKTLIIGPAWVGDMVMAQTLLKLLKVRSPSIVIDVLAPATTLPLLSRMREVNRALLLPFNRGDWKFFSRLSFGRNLRRWGYQQAIVLPNSFKSALVPFFANIPERRGWLGEFRWGLLNEARKLSKSQLPLMVQRFMTLGLLQNEDLPELAPFWPRLEVSRENTQVLLNQFDLTTQRPILALCPGAEYGPAKRWLPAYFAEIAYTKFEQGWQVWILGSPKDQAIAAQIQQHANNLCIDLTGRTKLEDAIDLIALASAVVSNDSGLMHIASAVNRPLVVIYGSSSPAFTPPLTERVKILSLNLPCSPCFKRECPLGHFDCMNQLKPQQVLTALTNLLSSSSA